VATLALASAGLLTSISCEVYLAPAVDEALSLTEVATTAAEVTFPATTVGTAGAGGVGCVSGLMNVSASAAGDLVRLSVATVAFEAGSMAPDLLALAVDALVDAIRELDFALARRVTGMVILEIACKGNTGRPRTMRELGRRVCCSRMKNGS